MKLLRAEDATSLQEQLIGLTSWAEGLASDTLSNGKALPFWQIAEARQVGVRKPAAIRIKIIESIPRPVDYHQYQLALNSGLLGKNAPYLALGYALMIDSAHVGRRQILRQALQCIARCEVVGSLHIYLRETFEKVRSQRQAIVAKGQCINCIPSTDIEDSNEHCFDRTKHPRLKVPAENPLPCMTTCS